MNAPTSYEAPPPYETEPPPPYDDAAPPAYEAPEKDAPAGVVIIKDAAAQRLKLLIKQEDRDDLRLRVAVQPGGCSGMKYELFFDERSLDGDKVTAYEGFEVVVDRMSVPYLTGAAIDFTTGLNAQFTIENPNAGGSCACGDSFH